LTSAISVIIPTFNRDKLLKRCINSVLNAIATQDEVIIVDAGTTGQTAALVSKYSDPRVRYIKQDDAGVSAARNLGMEEAKNDLLAFIDDDDEWHPLKLDIQRQLLHKHPECVACFSNFWSTFSQGNKKQSCLFNWDQPIQNWNQLLGETRKFILNKTNQEYDYYFGEHYFNQMLDDYILPTSLLVNRSKFKKQLIFRVGMQRNESWLYTSQVSRQGPVIYVDYDLACQHGDAENRLTSIPNVDYSEMARRI